MSRVQDVRQGVDIQTRHGGGPEAQELASSAGMLRLASGLAVECEGRDLVTVEATGLESARQLPRGCKFGLCKDTEGGQRQGLGSESWLATDHRTGQAR